MGIFTQRDTVSRRALCFTILTAACTEEVTALTGRIRLETEALDHSCGADERRSAACSTTYSSRARYLGPASRTDPPFALSENAMLYRLQKTPPKGLGLPFTVHGFKSSFRGWAAEATDFPNEVVEVALAHAIHSKSEAAYRRGALPDKRRSLMESWAGYLQSAEQPRYAASRATHTHAKPRKTTCKRSDSKYLFPAPLKI